MTTKNGTISVSESIHAFIFHHIFFLKVVFIQFHKHVNLIKEIVSHIQVFFHCSMAKQ